MLSAYLSNSNTYGRIHIHNGGEIKSERERERETIQSISISVLRAPENNRQFNPLCVHRFFLYIRPTESDNQQQSLDIEQSERTGLFTKTRKKYSLLIKQNCKNKKYHQNEIHRLGMFIYQ